MSNSLIVFQNPETSLDYLREEVAGDEVLGLLNDVNVDNLIPYVTKIKGSGDFGKMQVMVGKQTAGDTVGYLFFSIAEIGGSRILWPPTQAAEGETNRPVCSTGQVLASRMDTARGRWFKSENMIYQPPEESIVGDTDNYYLVDCSTCPWNKFDSLREWRPGIESRAKADKESRAYYGFLCTELTKLGKDQTSGDDIYSFDLDLRFRNEHINPYGIVKLPFSLGSDSDAIRKMSTLAISLGKPLSSLVWKAKVKMKTSGQMTWGYYEVSMAGYLASRDRIDYVRAARPWIKDYVEKVSDTDIEKPDEVSEVGDGKKDDAPF